MQCRREVSPEQMLKRGHAEKLKAAKSKQKVEITAAKAEKLTC
jgi:hypothetical protein